jgi:hypothetical protein
MKRLEGQALLDVQREKMATEEAQSRYHLRRANDFSTLGVLRTILGV